MNLLTQLLSRPSSPTRTRRRRGRGIELKTEAEIATMRQASRIVATVLHEIAQRVQPGMTTADLDAYAEARIREL